MHFLIFLIFLCFFLFLFVLYFLSKDDFVLTRKDVTLEKIFNIAFIEAGAALFFARVFYGIFVSKSIFANPFTFFLFPYYPGFSLLGAVLGGILVLLLVGKGESLPKGRIFDFFTIALVSVLPIGFLGYFLLRGERLLSLSPLFLIGSYFVLIVIFILFLLPKLMSGRLKDGTIGFLFLISFSAVNLISNAFLKINFLYFFKNPENIILMLTLVASIGLIVKREDLLVKMRKLRSKK